MNSALRNNSSYHKWYSIILGWITFLSLFDPKANGLFNLNLLPILFLCLFVLVAFGISKKQLRFKLDLLPALFICLYLLYAFYAIFTRNPHQAGVYFENKLSFLLLPFLFSFRPTSKISFSPIIYGWVLGCLWLIINSFIHSFQCAANPINSGCFVASTFSFQHHPTYTSIFHTVAFFFTIHAYRTKMKGFSLPITVLIAILLTLGIFLCLSLAGMLFFMFSLAISIVWLIAKKWGRIWGIVSVLAFPFILYLLIFNVPRIEGEWSNATWYAEQYLKEPKTYVQNCKPPHSGTQTRLIMWTLSYQACLDYPLGVGTGNVDEVLAHYQRQYNQEDMIQYQYNPHNQYLQTWLEIGIFGLLILIAVFSIAIVVGIRSKNYLLIIVSSCLAFNCLFESIFQRQSGIFYGTFLLLIIQLYASNAQLFHQKQES